MSVYVCVCMCVHVAYNFDELRDGDLKLHGDGVGHVLHRSDELVVSPEQLPEEPVLRLG